MGDTSRGLYDKFALTYTCDETCGHVGCDGYCYRFERGPGLHFYVLDLDHDPFAPAAQDAYLKAGGIFDPGLVATRTDGKNEAGQKHYECRQIVIDLDDQEDAGKAALQAYADACAKEYPLLAADLWRHIDPTAPAEGVIAAPIAEGGQE